MPAASDKSFVDRFRRALRLDKLSPALRKGIIAVAGGVVLVAGLAMLILPGPAFVVVPLGLAILATEFNWARNWLRKAGAAVQRFRERRRRKRQLAPH